MFELNPHGLLDAWWQHLLMVVVAALIGYIIGYRSGNGTIMMLEDRLARLGVDIEKCKKSLITTNTSTASLHAIPTAASITPDDLKKIEGIGPKIEQLLNNAGILTFQQLSETPVTQLQDILSAAGERFQMHRPQTWPDQALMAHQGRWEELKQWQDKLDGGIA